MLELEAPVDAAKNQTDQSVTVGPTCGSWCDGGLNLGVSMMGRPILWLLPLSAVAAAFLLFTAVPAGRVERPEQERGAEAARLPPAQRRADHPQRRLGGASGRQPPAGVHLRRSAVRRGRLAGRRRLGGAAVPRGGRRSPAPAAQRRGAAAASAEARRGALLRTLRPGHRQRTLPGCNRPRGGPEGRRDGRREHRGAWPCPTACRRPRPCCKRSSPELQLLQYPGETVAVGR